MSQEGPKLYTNKPKKAQLKKQLQQQQQQQQTPTQTTTIKTSSSSSSSASEAAAASYKMKSQSTPPPPPPSKPPKESFSKRFKFLVPLVLAVNVAVGAYLFMRTKKKDEIPEEDAASTVPSTPVSSTPTATAPVIEKPVPSPSILEPVKLREPIPEYQQRELFKWILEEKRKVKPRDPEDKKRIDQEKDVLKQFIRAKSIPNI